LEIETELAFTFCDMAQRTQGQERRTQLLGDIRKVVTALRYFEERITDCTIRADILNKADRLDDFLAQFSN